MPRSPRRSKTARRRIPANISDEYLDELRIRDFLGELTEDEILVAKKFGCYCWDLIIKSGRDFAIPR
jgi:hypothetical protein